MEVEQGQSPRASGSAVKLKSFSAGAMSFSTRLTGWRTR